MRRVFWSCLLVAMSFVLLAASAAAKRAPNPKCGDTITTSIKLTANLNCSARFSDGLKIGANGIVINLNGHSIIGSGGVNGFSGIVNHGFSRVTVKNGTIRNFWCDYESSDAHHERVTRVHFFLNGKNQFYGIHTTSGGGNTYSYNTAQNAAFGIASAAPVAPNTFVFNTLTGNAIGASEYSSSVKDTWTANTFSKNTGDGFYGVDSRTILTGNTSSHNGGYGFDLQCEGYGNTVVTKNTATFNGSGGIYTASCYHLKSFSTFKLNKTNNNVGAGIWSYLDKNATFDRNTANANTTNGFYFQNPSGYVIKSNLSTGNGSDGVYFLTGGSDFPSVVASNTSTNNGGYGFNADAPVTGSGDSGTANTSGLFNSVSG